MTLVTPPSADLPVIWWVFWLVVLGIGVFGAFAWWITREALEEDRSNTAGEESRMAIDADGASPAERLEHDRAETSSREGDGDSLGT